MMIDKANKPNSGSDKSSFEDASRKEKNVHTSICLKNLKAHFTEVLTNPNEMQKCLFLKNVANDSLHHTGKFNHLCNK